MGILMALKAFALIEGDDKNVQPALIELVTDKAGRKGHLGKLVRAFYARQLEVSARNGTEKMLLDSFEQTFGLTGDTRRKAATWFLHAARESGIQVSEHFPKVRSGSGSAPGSRGRRTPKHKGATPALKIEDADSPSQGDDYTVKLQAGGTVTLSVKVGHFALSRNKTDRDFVQKLIDALTSYEDGHPEAPDKGNG